MCERFARFAACLNGLGGLRGLFERFGRKSIILQVRFIRARWTTGIGQAHFVGHGGRPLACTFRRVGRSALGKHISPGGAAGIGHAHFGEPSGQRWASTFRSPLSRPPLPRTHNTTGSRCSSSTYLCLVFQAPFACPQQSRLHM